MILIIISRLVTQTNYATKALISLNFLLLLHLQSLYAFTAFQFCCWFLDSKAVFILEFWLLKMIVGQNMVAETEIICQNISGAVLDVQYHVNSSASTPPIFHELRVSDSVSSEISGFESVSMCMLFLIFEITQCFWWFLWVVLVLLHLSLCVFSLGFVWIDEITSLGCLNAWLNNILDWFLQWIYGSNSWIIAFLSVSTLLVMVTSVFSISWGFLDLLSFMRLLYMCKYYCNYSDSWFIM